MKAIVTVVGKDQVGIIAGVCNRLAEHNINVLDISQTVMQGYFTMMMVVDLSLCDAAFDELPAFFADFRCASAASLTARRIFSRSEPSSMCMYASSSASWLDSTYADSAWVDSIRAS